VDTTEAPAPAAPSRAWIGRAAFEASLIVLGLVGALIVEEWRETRERAERVRSAIASIRSELEADRKELARAIADHDEIIAALEESMRTGVPYENAVMRSRAFSSVAWEAARDAAITNDIDHATLMALGRAYGALAELIRAREVFLNFVYTNIATDVRRNPRFLRGWLRDLRGHAQRVDGRLRETLGVLNTGSG
jgi:hypothetical protein